MIETELGLSVTKFGLNRVHMYQSSSPDRDEDTIQGWNVVLVLPRQAASVNTGPVLLAVFKHVANYLKIYSNNESLNSCASQCTRYYMWMLSLLHADVPNID
uniref:Uncharacterized protein n=1 Tax=Timema monikensis TaxID=170555 RepID=A0A7R9E0Y5_9NEOP|nr:unnamed protein product [Timema monikensis]